MDIATISRALVMLTLDLCFGAAALVVLLQVFDSDIDVTPLATCRNRLMVSSALSIAIYFSVF